MEIELSSMLPTDWRDWEDSLDTIGSPGPFEMDLGLDNFLLANADDFAEPFAAQTHATLASPPDSPSYAPAPAAPSAPLMQQQPHAHLHMHHHMHMHAPLHFQQQQPHVLRDEDEELLALADGEMFMYEHEQGGVLSEHLFKCESITDLHAMSAYNNSSSSSASSPSNKRKRPTGEMHHYSEQLIKQEPLAVPTSPEKKFKSQAPGKLDEQAERLYRRRYDILHEILEAWNTGGIEDMEEIADSVYDDDVTLISPDYTDGLRGVHAIMSHWNDLLDAFPDGIMEEYEIQREDANGEKLKATWVFSGTQIFPIFGVEPRHEKVCISGTSFFSFKGDKIRQVVLSWNYREALMKLMGVPPSKAVVLSAHIPSNAPPAAQAAAMARALAAHP